jgi:hypothetical protein
VLHSLQMPPKRLSVDAEQARHALLAPPVSEQALACAPSSIWSAPNEDWSFRFREVDREEDHSIVIVEAPGLDPDRTEYLRRYSSTSTLVVPSPTGERLEFVIYMRRKDSNEGFQLGKLADLTHQQQFVLFERDSNNALMLGKDGVGLYVDSGGAGYQQIVFQQYGLCDLGIGTDCG